jgi:hypothetical protein
MTNRFKQIIFYATLAMALLASGLCPAISAAKNKVPCRNAEASHHQHSQDHPEKPCKIAPCSKNKLGPPSLTETLIRPEEKRSRHFSDIWASGIKGKLSLHTAGFAHFNPFDISFFSFKPPPVIYLHCVMIC